MKTSLIINDAAKMKAFLDEMAQKYETKDFIAPDPISIPHRYELKEDIEIAGFLAATIAWGQRPTILKNGHRLMDILGSSPFDFIMNHRPSDLQKLDGFVHRTFQSIDLKHFIKALRHIYTRHEGLESIFIKHQTEDSLHDAITALHHHFFEIPHEKRTTKHVANPSKGSVAKRIHMFLRWMIRSADRGVDFGLWDILPSKLSIPMDVHVANMSRKLGLIQGKQNNLRSLTELNNQLRNFDAVDPVKYDFALFGMGVNKGWCMEQK